MTEKQEIHFIKGIFVGTVVTILTIVFTIWLTIKF